MEEKVPGYCDRQILYSEIPYIRWHRASGLGSCHGDRLEFSCQAQAWTPAGIGRNELADAVPLWRESFLCSCAVLSWIGP